MSDVLTVDDMYSTPSLAREEIWRRSSDENLRKKTELFLGEKLPDIFSEKPKAVIFRNIATPNFEMKIAHEYACLLGMELVVIEYTSDKFCTRNQDKLHLGKMMFFDNENKTQIIAKENVIAIKEQDNKCFNDVRTINDEDFVGFHHRIFKDCGYGGVEFFDASIYKNAGLSPYEIYLKILGICSCNAILLENFLIKSDKGEAKFTESVILPAFLEVAGKIGVTPLIVPLLTCDGGDGLCWQHYSSDVSKFLNCTDSIKNIK